MKAKIWWIISTSIVITLVFLLSIIFFNPVLINGRDKIIHITGKGENTLDTPMAVVSDGKKVFIANGNKNQISVFNLKGEYISHFGKSGINNGEFQYPVDLILHPNRKLYVADFNNKRIQVFTTKGKHLSTFGQDLDMKPTAITTDSRGFLFVSDIQSQTIKVFSEDGKFLFEFGGYGEEPGFFNYVNGIASSDSGEEIFISDSQNARIQVFTKDGEFLKVLPVDKSLGLPKGIDIFENYLYVADTLLHKIFVIDMEGKVIETLGEKNMIFKFPNDVYKSKEHLFIVDRATNSTIIQERRDDHE